MIRFLVRLAQHMNAENAMLRRRLIQTETALSTMTHARDVSDGQCRMLRRQLAAVLGHPCSDGWLTVPRLAVGGDDETLAYPNSGQ
jgi:hypothetical protein